MVFFQQVEVTNLLLCVFFLAQAKQYVHTMAGSCLGDGPQKVTHQDSYNSYGNGRQTIGIPSAVTVCLHLSKHRAPELSSF